MATERAFPITANTSAGEILVYESGPHQVSIQGDFGGGTLTQYVFTDTSGRGAAVRAATTVEEVYQSNVKTSEYVLTGATSPDLNVIVTDL